MNNIAERDWRHLRAIKQELLASACEDIFHKIEQVAASRHGKEHQAYRELWKLLEQEDRKISEMFDDLTRSKAIFRIAALVGYGVLSPQQLSGFSAETRQQVSTLVGFQRR